MSDTSSENGPNTSSEKGPESTSDMDDEVSLPDAGDLLSDNFLPDADDALPPGIIGSDSDDDLPPSMPQSDFLPDSADCLPNSDDDLPPALDSDSDSDDDLPPGTDCLSDSDDDLPDSDDAYECHLCGEEVELPEPDEEVKVRSLCCLSSCTDKFTDDPMLGHLHDRIKAASGGSDCDRIVYDLLLDIVKSKEDDDADSRKCKWVLLGKPVCLVAWRRLLHLSPQKFYKLKVAALNGALSPPDDLRRSKKAKAAVKSDDVDSWFCWAYQNLSEPLATEGSEKALKSSVRDADDIFSEWATLRNPRADPVILASRDAHTLEPRHLHPTSLAEAYDHYKRNRELTHAAAGFFTFKNVYERWRKCLPIRRVSEHARCNECAVNTKMRKDARTPEDRNRMSE